MDGHFHQTLGRSELARENPRRTPCRRDAALSLMCFASKLAPIQLLPISARALQPGLGNGPKDIAPALDAA